MKTLGPREATSNQIDLIIKSFEDYFKNNQETKSCYVYGMGGQTKAAYRELALLDGVSLRLSHTCLSGWMAFLSFIPSFAGVIQILRPSRLNFVTEKLGDSTMVGIYIFDSRKDKEFIEFVKTKPHPKAIDSWFNSVDEGIFYQFDSSNGSSKTRMYDWLMIGDNISSSVALELLKCFGEY